MTLPRYGPAVLRALAAWDAARRSAEPQWPRMVQLVYALDEDRARRAAVPVLPDEGERDASPHRFAHPHGGPL